MSTVLFAAGCAGSQQHSAPASPVVGLSFLSGSARQSVEFTGRTLSGAPFSLRDLRGHVIVVNVWASWCSECRAESPLLARTARRLTARGVKFVGIDELDKAVAARRFATAAGAGYPEVFDPTGRVLARLPQLPQTGIPSTLVVDSKGRATARIVGAAHAGQLRRAIAAAGRGS